MKKGWTITEKVISTILQGWALFFLYIITSELYTRMHFVMANGQVAPSNTSYTDVVKFFHADYLSGLLAMYAGLALLYDKKGGWVASVISTILFAGYFLVAGRDWMTKAKDPQVLTGAGYFIAAAVFAGLFLLLVQKPFRAKYKPNIVNWLVIIIAVIVVVIDKSIFRLAA